MSDGDAVPTGTEETTGGAPTPVLTDDPETPAPVDEEAGGYSEGDAGEDVAPGEPTPGELHPLFVGYDRDGDGAADLVEFDRNTDGSIDAIVADNDFDGRPDTAVLDENLDGQADVEIVDPDEDGNLDLVLTDEDHDGQFDTAHFGDDDSNPLPDAGEMDSFTS